MDRATYISESLCKDIRIMIEMLTPLASSYRLLVGAADEFNKISLAHRKDVEDAIDRADDLGHIIDDLDETLKKILHVYLKGVDCKIDFLNKEELNILLCEKHGYGFQNAVKEAVAKESLEKEALAEDILGG